MSTQDQVREKLINEVQRLQKLLNHYQRNNEIDIRNNDGTLVCVGDQLLMRYGEDDYA